MSLPKYNQDRRRSASPMEPERMNSELKKILRLVNLVLDEGCDVADRYRALAMIRELTDTADRRFCRYCYNLIPDGLPDRTYEEFIDPAQRPVVALALQ